MQVDEIIPGSREKLLIVWGEMERGLSLALEYIMFYGAIVIRWCQATAGRLCEATAHALKDVTR